MANYTSNEVVDILLIFGECHRNYRNASRLYAERYPDRRHPNPQQIINIERRFQNPFHRDNRTETLIIMTKKAHSHFGYDSFKSAY